MSNNLKQDKLGHGISHTDHPTTQLLLGTSSKPRACPKTENLERTLESIYTFGFLMLLEKLNPFPK